jgi:hypothetical protein
MCTFEKNVYILFKEGNMDKELKIYLFLLEIQLLTACLSLVPPPRDSVGLEGARV